MQLAAGFFPLHGGPQRAPLHDHGLARIDPLHVTGRPPAQETLEQAGRPQFAVSRNQVAHRRRCTTDESHGLQDPCDIAAILVQDDQELVTQLACQQFMGEADVPLAQFLQSRINRGIALLGQPYQGQEGVGNATAGREHDGLALRRIGFDDRRDPQHARPIGDAGPAELVNFPRLHGLDARSCTRPATVRPVARRDGPD